MVANNKPPYSGRRRELFEEAARKYERIILEAPNGRRLTAFWLVLELIKKGHREDVAFWAVHDQIQDGKIKVITQISEQ